MGIAFLLHYATGWKRMGRPFTLKTFAAVGLLALLTNVVPILVHFEALNPVFTAVMGGLLMGAVVLNQTLTTNHRVGRYMAL